MYHEPKIQHDCQINPHNRGGKLVSEHGGRHSFQQAPRVQDSTRSTITTIVHDSPDYNILAIAITIK